MNSFDEIENAGGAIVVPPWNRLLASLGLPWMHHKTSDSILMITAILMSPKLDLKKMKSAIHLLDFSIGQIETIEKRSKAKSKLLFHLRLSKSRLNTFVKDKDYKDYMSAFRQSTRAVCRTLNWAKSFPKRFRRGQRLLAK